MSSAYYGYGECSAYLDMEGGVDIKSGVDILDVKSGRIYFRYFGYCGYRDWSGY